MSLTQRLATPPVKVTCKVCRSIAEHPEGAAIRRAVDNSGWSHADLARELAAEGVEIGESTIRRHRAACKRK